MVRIGTNSSEAAKCQEGLGSGLKNPRALLHMVYHQSQWSAWAAVAAGMAALFALADGFVRQPSSEAWAFS